MDNEIEVFLEMQRRIIKPLKRCQVHKQHINRSYIVEEFIVHLSAAPHDYKLLNGIRQSSLNFSVCYLVMLLFVKHLHHHQLVVFDVRWVRLLRIFTPTTYTHSTALLLFTWKIPNLFQKKKINQSHRCRCQFLGSRKQRRSNLNVS